MSKAAPRNQRSGVSLLEMMISLAVMAMIAVTLASLMGGTSKVLMRTVGVSASVETALARDQLRRWVEDAISQPQPGEAREAAGLWGGAETLRFRAIVDDGQFWPGDHISVSLGMDAEHRVVLTAEGASAETRAPIQRATLLTGSQGSIRIEYFGRRVEIDQPIWHNDWPLGRELPDLLRITLIDRNQTYPPLTLRPAKTFIQSERSLSSLLPPALPSRP